MSEHVCPACDGSSLEALEAVDVAGQHAVYAPRDKAVQRQLTEAAAATSLVYRMLRCRRCGLEFGSPLQSPTADWYAIAYRVLNLYPRSRWEFGEVLRHIRPPQGIFEIGCGSGMFLEKCRAAGIQAQGIDFIEEAVNACAAKGLNASLERLGEAPPSPASGEFKHGFPHIAAFHVIEHLDRPRGLFERASRLAGGNSHLWVSVPSDRRPSRRLGRKDFLDQPPHHMSRWTPQAFAAIGALAGWHLAGMIYEPISPRKDVWARTALSAPANGEKSSWRETASRLARLPRAIVQRRTTESPFSGFSMLAHFVFKNSAR
jgi:2-polyprenyl-3-methyl-5-hydroxy-6-metoxy-1,4-benzoquinol methylase